MEKLPFQEKELREFAILNFSAQESLQDQETAQVAHSLRHFLEQNEVALQEIVHRYRLSIKTTVAQQIAVTNLYQETMDAYIDYQTAAQEEQPFQGMEEPIMAEEITKEAQTETKELTPEEQKATERAERGKKLMADLRTNANEQFKGLVAEGKAFWQDKTAEVHRPYNPTHWKDKQGYTSINAAILMQAQAERGLKDARWISYTNLKKSPDLELKDPNIKPTKIIAYAFDKEQKKNRPVSVVSVYNYADLKGVKERDNYCPSDNWAKAFRDNINFTGKGEMTISDVARATAASLAQAHAQFRAAEKANAKAGRAADNAALREEMAALQPKEQERIQALANYDVKANEKKFKKMPAGEQFFHEMAKNYQENPEAKAFAVNAVKSALLRGTKEDEVAKAVNKYAPKAVYDAAKKEHHMSSYSKYILSSLKKDKAFQKEINNTKAAQR